MENKMLIGAVVRDSSASMYSFFNYIQETCNNIENVDLYFINMIPCMDVINSILQFKTAYNKVYMAGCQARYTFAGESITNVSSLEYSECKNIIVKFAREKGYSSILILDQSIKANNISAVKLVEPVYEVHNENWEKKSSYFNINGSILNSIMKIAIEGINLYCTIDYRNMTEIERCSCFSKSALKETINRRHVMEEMIIRNKLVLRSRILDIIIYDIDSNRGYALAAFKALNSPLEQGVLSDDIISGKVLLCGCGDSWFIDRVLIGNITPCNGNSMKLYPEAVSLKPNKLTLSMLVRNEADRYLPRVLEHASKYVDNAVILDDASEDETVSVCRNILHNMPLTIVSNPRTEFSNEISVRKQQWGITVDTNPDWILNLDADEILEDRAAGEIRRLIDNPHFDFYMFRLYDFWDDNHYREDEYWKAHMYSREFLVKYIPGYNYTWAEIPQHCGRFPNNIKHLMGLTSAIRVKHFGWAREKDRIKKYKRYMELDPEGKYGIMEQYKSILDANPSLVEWEE